MCLKIDSQAYFYEKKLNLPKFLYDKRYIKI